MVIKLPFDKVETPRQEKETCAAGLRGDSRMASTTVTNRITAPLIKIILLGVVIVETPLHLNEA